MRNVLIVIIIIVVGTGGYLGWDWHAKTQKQKLEPSVTLYYWMDSNGNKHVSDTPPPKSARNVYTEKGYKHIKAPLIVTLQHKAVELFKKTKEKIFKPGKNKKK